MLNLITQAELAAFSPALDLTQYSSTTISGIIGQASQAVQDYCSVDGFFKESVTGETGKAVIDTAGNLVINFRRRPVARGDVSAIRLVGIDVNQSLLLTNSASTYSYFISQPGTVLTYPSNFLVSHGVGLMSIRGANLMYQVDYVGGYATDVANIPFTLKQACILFALDIFAQNQDLLGVKSFSQGSYKVEYADNGHGYSKMVAKAHSLLDAGGYARKSIF